MSASGSETINNVVLIPCKGLTEKMKPRIEAILLSRVPRYLKGFELPSPKARFSIELVVDDDCEVCPVAIEVFTELAALFPENVELKIYNASYVEPPFDITATPATRINNVVRFYGIPVDDEKLRKYLHTYVTEAYVRTHPRLQELLTRLQSFAEKHGYYRNPNDTQFMYLIAKLLKNIDLYGYPFCPCRPLRKVAGATPERIYELNKDKVCPCIYVYSDIQRYGHCLCGLFWSREAFEKYVSERLARYGWMIEEIAKIEKVLPELRKRIIGGRARPLLESIINKLQHIYVSLDEE